MRVARAIHHIGGRRSRKGLRRGKRVLIMEAPRPESGRSAAASVRAWEDPGSSRWQSVGYKDPWPSR